MITRDSLVAGVLSATDRVVQQATAGDWSAALKSSHDRRLLLEQLAQQSPQAGEHDFVRALREAAAESDAALATMSAHQDRATVRVDESHSSVGNRLCTKA
jgi:hypothetical protein